MLFRKKTSQLAWTLVALCFLSCQQGPKDGVESGNFSLRMVAVPQFQTAIDHGQLREYRITILAGEGSTPIVRYFPAGTAEARFDSFAAGSMLDITAEVINVNGQVIRRGRVEDLKIEGGRIVPVDMSVNPVPIFANLREGARVPQNRFLPRVFVAGSTELELWDHTDSGVRQLVNALTAEPSFSLSDSAEPHVAALSVGILPTGQHELSLRDARSGESSQVSIEILPPVRKQILPSTAGGFVGGLMAGQKAQNSLTKSLRQKVRNTKGE